MDSGNSGSLSLQSSSGGGGGGGGDDEFDSRCGGDSSPLSELLRQQPPPAPSSGVLPGFGGGGPFYGIQELATPPLSHWSSSTPLPSGGTTGSGGAPPSLPPSSSSRQQVVVAVSAAGSHKSQEAAAAPRGSRKRTRASRRAPTTVLTTDTSNFRAMVQEFTGIPAPPFARFRLDHLYPSRSGSSAGTTLAPYLHPFAHNKLQASPYYPPFVPASSSPANNKARIAPTSTTALSAVAVAATSGSYHHSGGGGGYLPFYQSTTGAHVDGNGGGRYDPASHVHPMFDATRTTSAHAQRPLAHGIVNSSEATHLHLHRDLGRSGDELSGLVRGSSRSVSIPDGGCNNTTTHSSSGAGPGAASRAGPLLGRNTQSATTPTPAVGATATMRAQAGVDSWICSTSE